MHLIDTDIAIHVRDATSAVVQMLRILGSRPKISLMTWVELEGGTHKIPDLAPARRSAVDRLLQRMTILPVDAMVVRQYSSIVSTCGFSRRRVIDRLIAATAIVNDLSLITMNGDDFRDIPALKLETWPLPAQ